MKFHLCNGTDNTFIICSSESADKWITKQSRNKVAKTICKNMGSGADGFIIIRECTESNENHFEWDFYNSDGSSAEMCGNAARCAALYISKVYGYSKSLIKLKTKAGTVSLNFLTNNFISVEMPEYKVNLFWENEDHKDSHVKVCHINTGVPHYVMEVPDLSKDKLLKWVSLYRYNNRYSNSGSNVSFFSKSKGTIEAITFERGVEDFTSSCGTGVSAVALSILLKEKNFNTTKYGIDINTPGGTLRVELDEFQKNYWLIGPARIQEVIEIYEFSERLK